MTEKDIQKQLNKVQQAIKEMPTLQVETLDNELTTKQSLWFEKHYKVIIECLCFAEHVLQIEPLQNKTTKHFSDK